MNIIQQIASKFKKKVDSKIQEKKEKEISKEQLKNHIASVVEEYNLIQYGTSKLSRRKRDEVVAYMAKLEELEYVKINRNEE